MQHMVTTRREHDCPLCGLTFPEGGLDCGPCPFSARGTGRTSSCVAVTCPRCGYVCEMPSLTSRLLRSWRCELGGWLRRVASRA